MKIEDKRKQPKVYFSAVPEGKVFCLFDVFYIKLPINSGINAYNFKTNNLAQINPNEMVEYCPDTTLTVNDYRDDEIPF